MLFVYFFNSSNNPELVSISTLIIIIHGSWAPNNYIHTVSRHITLQPKTGFPLKLSRIEPGQYLDGRPPGKTRFAAGSGVNEASRGAHPGVCVGPNDPV